MTLAQAGAKLRGLVKGGFRSIKVLAARLLAARRARTGRRDRRAHERLRAHAAPRFGLYDTWAYYTTITSTKKTTTPARRRPRWRRAGRSDDRRHGADRAGGRRTAGHTVLPARSHRPGAAPGCASSARSRALGHVRLDDAGRGGRYRQRLGGHGVYRVLFQGAPGPEVRAELRRRARRASARVPVSSLRRPVSHAVACSGAIGRERK